jgi:hypothetical protein
MTERAAKLPKHTDQSRTVLERLAGWGFPVEVQQRMGALGVVWGVFETNLESTLWVLHDESVLGIRPSTDKSTVSDWIKSLGEGSEKLGNDAQDLLKTAAHAATDLMEYRHALLHGWLIPFPSGPTFIRNPSWNGELRKRPSSDAHVDENLLDMAIDSAWILCRFVFATREACKDASKLPQLLSIKGDLVRARSQASELRHLTALMNHEKN